ncbi:unnamed protein product [Brachionus calyciflorus]|uniref:Anamorsin homolog n=1 Tax=Brachionus calyciflorus TaxID=104777 RepID=A0A813MGA4_9BILA|nr:unnamed protein product [Brachionus calyciflorus]
MNETTLNNILNKIESNSTVLVVFQGEQAPSELNGLTNRISERSVSNLDIKSSTDAQTITSSYDLIISLNGDANYELYFKILKPNGRVLVNESENLESALKLNGFQNFNKEDSFCTAQKPNFEVGATRKLNFKTQPKKVWQFTEDDIQENDLINTDDLLDDLDLKKPEMVDNFDCGTSATGKKKACKNCSCGLAEELENEAASVQKKNQETVKSSCGSCYLGDAFRCAGCPYLGMPAFKPGEKVQLGGGLAKSDL